ncbi:hypothetical protein CASFOL_029835 [Castilleja foliolosa]|uniref:DNA topoisomerase I eukaryotic-type domain-containing protein n=1 Tax=Castilleja foliolosa TaxID=1961234 RepID=A0ABD3C922_9LAMI
MTKCKSEIPSKKKGNNNKPTKVIMKNSTSSSTPPVSGDVQKWTSLSHNGVIFPPPYKPHGVKMLYKGIPVELSPEQEEAATMYAEILDSYYYVENPKFNDNFMADWQKILGNDHVIQSLEHCDFTPIYEWHQNNKERKKTTEEKLAFIEEKRQEEEKYLWAIVDGVKEKVENFRIGPPGVFRGRDRHPRSGKLKRRICPSDITINIGKDSPIPECPFPGQRWKSIVHDNTVTWLARWKDPIDRKGYRYVLLAGPSAKMKYEKARLLKNYLFQGAYINDITSDDIAKRQTAVLTSRIDKLSLRAGDDKDAHDSYEREAVVALEKEKEKLQNDERRRKQHVDNMKVIASVIDRINELSSLGSLSLESLAKSFVDFQTRYPDDNTICNLSCIPCPYALPLFIRIFHGWDPLQNPTQGVEVVSMWKKLLQDKDSSSFTDSASPYMQLLMEVVFPAVRISGTNSWHARNPEPMLRFLESWKELLPPVVLQAILDTVIMPKLLAAMNTWVPRRETIPIHFWIHPWLPFLGQKLENCYHTIRHRLSSVLHAWHPSSMSAYYILSPWKGVFDPASWEQLMARYIIPKLLTVMHELPINPSSQNFDQFYWVRTWVTAIPTHHMLQLMDIFFNKWQEVLYHWLCSKPNIEEVTKWYLGWKEQLPAELQANKHVRFRLNIGLDMMNQAVEGMEVAPPGLRENISYLRDWEQRQFETQKNASEDAQRRI